MATTRVERGSGWLLFSAVLLVLAGAMGILDGLWAIINGDEQEALIGDNVVVFDTNLAAWGWIHLGVGIVVFLAGFAVISGAEWARVVGIIVAAIWIIVRIPWVFAFPIPALIGIFVSILVIYGLTVYGGRESY